MKKIKKKYSQVFIIISVVRKETNDKDPKKTKKTKIKCIITIQKTKINKTKTY